MGFAAGSGSSQGPCSHGRMGFRWWTQSYIQAAVGCGQPSTLAGPSSSTFSPMASLKTLKRQAGPPGGTTGLSCGVTHRCTCVGRGVPGMWLATGGDREQVRLGEGKVTWLHPAQQTQPLSGNQPVPCSGNAETGSGSRCVLVAGAVGEHCSPASETTAASVCAGRPACSPHRDMRSTASLFCTRVACECVFMNEWSPNLGKSRDTLLRAESLGEASPAWPQVALCSMRV